METVALSQNLNAMGGVNGKFHIRNGSRMQARDRAIRRRCLPKSNLDMKKKDKEKVMRSSGRIQLVIALVCIYCHLVSGAVYGQECGANPMKQVLMVAKRTGRTLTHVLDVLRDIDAPAYRTLAQKFRMYAACVGLVDTGYFKKRADPAVPPFLNELERNEGQDMEVPFLDSSAFSRLNLPNDGTGGHKAGHGPSNAAKISWLMNLMKEKAEGFHDQAQNNPSPGQSAMAIDAVITYLQEHLHNNNSDNNKSKSKNSDTMSYFSKSSKQPGETDSLFDFSHNQMELPQQLE